MHGENYMKHDLQWYVLSDGNGNIPLAEHQNDNNNYTKEWILQANCVKSMIDDFTVNESF